MSTVSQGFSALCVEGMLGGGGVVVSQWVSELRAGTFKKSFGWRFDVTVEKVAVLRSFALRDISISASSREPLPCYGKTS